MERDPIGYVDGMSLYRGYFVPNGTDALGLEKVYPQPFKPSTERPEIGVAAPAMLNQDLSKFCPTGWTLDTASPRDPINGMHAQQFTGWNVTKYGYSPKHITHITTNWDYAFFQTVFEKLPDSDFIIKTQTCGDPSQGSVTAGFSKQVTVGAELGVTLWEIVSASVSGETSIGETKSSTQYIKLPGDEGIQYLAVPVVEKLILRTNSCFIGEKSSPYAPAYNSEIGVPYKNYLTGTNKRTLGYLGGIKHVRCKSKCPSRGECD